MSLTETAFVVHLVCHYDDTNSVGGLEKQARLLAETLASQGRRILVLSSTRTWSKARWSSDGAVDVRLFWTPRSPQVSGRYLPAAILWGLQLLGWIARHRRRIAVLHVHQLRIHAFVAAIARRWFGIPIVLKSATGGSGADIRAIGSRKYFGSPGRRFLIRSGGIFIATTQSIFDDLIAYGVPRGSIRLIPNGTRIPEISSSPQAQRPHRCVFLGRVDRDKNPVNLALAAVEVAHGKFEVDIYGLGEEAADVQALINAAANPHVHYRGFSADPAGLLRGYGWLLLPSEAEGLSNSMIEAMVQGVVPVVTRVSGCTDHVQEGISGFFFDGTSVQQIERTLQRISRVTEGQWQALSRGAREHAAYWFDIDRVAQTYLALYRELAQRKSP